LNWRNEGAKLDTQAASYRFVERPNCPACRSPTAAALYACDFTEPPIATFISNQYKISTSVLASGRYELMRCGHCGLYYQRWMGDTDLLSELYGVWVNDCNIPDIDEIYQKELRHFAQSRDAHEIVAVASFIGVPVSRLRTLDYGMGWALWARIAKALGCHSFGTELSPARMDYAHFHGVEVLQDDEIGEAAFHFINTEQVMEHLSDPFNTGKRLAAALIPGGILKISVPSGEEVDRRLSRLKQGSDGNVRGHLAGIEPLEHVNCFTKKSLVKLAESLGLEIVRPALRDAYAFLRLPGGVSLARPAKAAKELIRPIYQFHNPRNLYVWMRKVPDQAIGVLGELNGVGR